MTSSSRIAVLDYGIGNLRSAQKALEYLGAQAELTADHRQIAAADAVVLPGVGAFGRCVEALAEADLAEVAHQAAIEASQGGRPFIGICVGMQMLFSTSSESPGQGGLGVFPGQIGPLADDVKHPQMQWNQLEFSSHPMFAGLSKNAWVYFVHGYVGPITEHTVATCDYGGPVCAAVAQKNLWATQFHPEKSGPTGLTVLNNFLNETAGSS
ncbi:MAG: imidazole glycerol phosphate synthase subunit HisH [Actinobacteria bacterium]|nr:imidazole glycerol phosphate synthase subunit HisH [Actinomycetota bacterium]MBT3746522.1 imidazole glycerol phosphate synthase subunit HisH [Actinomycetota bacterium]MBT3969951.1 imidazole glycerol phosphate synthase subunit HisH [Actinomycetota bacterium]MBT4008979.1 imidazole glycerol phosphate synthase subunit HisH [Actinomycetota bacterium]MBT4303921.1 imidazole glycerol phosphate synthase subunit HisH [Actinomycetota bacterium]